MRASPKFYSPGADRSPARLWVEWRPANVLSTSDVGGNPHRAPRLAAVCRRGAPSGHGAQLTRRVPSRRGLQPNRDLWTTTRSVQVPAILLSCRRHWGHQGSPELISPARPPWGSQVSKTCGALAPACAGECMASVAEPGAVAEDARDGAVGSAGGGGRLPAS